MHNFFLEYLLCESVSELCLCYFKDEINYN